MRSLGILSLLACIGCIGKVDVDKDGVSDALQGAVALTAKVVSASEVDLSWTMSITASSFAIKRGTSMSALSNLATSSTARFADKTVSAGTTYYYRVIATASNGVKYGSLITPVLVPSADICGDGVCGDSETCSSCSADCGVCPDMPTSAGTCAAVPENGSAQLACPAGEVIKQIDFASYGTPTGTCGSFSFGACNASDSLSTVQALCVGKSSCTIAAANATFGDPCVGTVKRLYLQVTCGASAAPSPPDMGQSSPDMTCASGACTQASSGGYLNVSGNNLVYDGQAVVLRGENFNNGTALFSSDTSLIDDNASDYAQAHNVLGANVIRWGMAFSWYSNSRSNFFAALDQHVAWAKANHLWMIPVMFMGPGNPEGNSYGGQDGFWSSASNQQLLTAFWQDVATHYANEPTIAGYDILNEPGPPSTAAYTAWAQSAYDAITTVDPNHFVAIEGDAANGGGSLPSVVGSSILWSAHCYGTAGSDCGFNGSSNAAPSRWPFWIGEMGATGSNGSSTSYVPHNLANYNAQGVSWTHFAMRWSAGGYGLYGSWSAGDFSSPWTEMIQVVHSATSGNVFPR